MYAMNNFHQRPAVYGNGDIGTGEYQYPNYMNPQMIQQQYDMQEAIQNQNYRTASNYMHNSPTFENQMMHRSSFCTNNSSRLSMCVHNISEANRSSETPHQAVQNTFNNVIRTGAKQTQSMTQISNRNDSWIDALCATPRSQKPMNENKKRSMYKVKHQCHYRAWKQKYWRLLNRSIKYKELKKASKKWEYAFMLDAKMMHMLPSFCRNNNSRVSMRQHNSEEKRSSDSPHQAVQSMLLKNHVHQYNVVYEKLRHLLIEYSKRIDEVQRFPGDVRKFEKHWSCLSRTLREQKTSIANLEHALSTKTEAFDHISACLERSEATSAYRKTAISNLKNEISEITSQKTKLEIELKEAQTTNKKLTVHCKHLTSQIELVEEKLKALKDINRKLDENFKAQMVCYELEKTSCHEECKSKTHESLVKMSSVYQKHLAELGNKQTFADAKIKELYLTIENIIKGLFRIKSEKEKGSEENENSERSDIDMLPKLVEWLQICNNMVYKPTFAEELSSFVLTLFNTSLQNTNLKEP